jgi:hypothetical protein
VCSLRPKRNNIQPDERRMIALVMTVVTIHWVCILTGVVVTVARQNPL